MSLLSFPIVPIPAVEPVTIPEAIAALQELIDAGFGRALSTFDKVRESRARLAALALIERDLFSRGTK